RSLSYEEMKNKVLSELKRHFRPEFLNRLDEVIVFHALSKEEIKKIVDLILKEEKKLLEEKEIDLGVTEKAKDLIAKEGYDPDFGARPLRRSIQRLIEDPLSEEILQGKFKEGDKVIADIRNGNIIFNKKKKLKQKNGNRKP
ncbi:MAG: ATP-dependent Clp protease ATP-binding subunit ClpC, partial [Candidatus Aerophobetes bacterium]|nr:ATP-dependent Clp protease ATP-binding subunit ClpC [Candidatus Aerophobetes bacterium]